MINLKLKIKKSKTVAKLLQEQLGGIWKYTYGGIWECNDGERTVRRNCMCDHDGDCNCIPAYHLYSDKENTKTLWFWGNKIEIMGERE